jgi:hypothetical protein
MAVPAIPRVPAGARRNVHGCAVIFIKALSKEMLMKAIIPAMTCAALLAMAGPAFAGKSTPQEREATKQLNLEAAQQAKNTNQQLAAASSSTAMSNTAMPSQSTPAPAPATAAESAPATEQANSAASPAQSPAGNSGVTQPAQ